jgi:hypothetical protein
MCNKQIKVIGVNIASVIYDIFGLGIFKILSTSYFEMCN